MDNRENLEKLLLEFNKKMHKEEVVFFLMHGTLLGCQRDKHLIPWDNDIDLGCLEKIDDVRDKIIKVLKEMECRIYITEDIEWRGKCVIVGVTKINNLITKKGNLSISIKFINRIADRYIESNSLVSYSLDSIKELEQILFLDDKFHIPAKPKILFNKWYSKGWNIKSKPFWIKKDIEPIELYEDQKMGYRADEVEEAFLKCDKDGKLIKPYEKTGKTPRR